MLAHRMVTTSVGKKILLEGRDLPFAIWREIIENVDSHNCR